MSWFAEDVEDVPAGVGPQDFDKVGEVNVITKRSLGTKCGRLWSSQRRSCLEWACKHTFAKKTSRRPFSSTARSQRPLIAGSSATSA